MKVNPLGIQAYQQLGHDRQSSVAAGVKTPRAAEQKVVIEPQAPVTRSALAVKAPSGSYARFLSAEERQALDMLFAKFSDTSRFGAAYASKTEEAESGGTLGRVVDVRV
jgi:hypothetical protein